MAPFVSCYRLQLNPYFPFRKAQHYLPYFGALGVDALYLSPIMRPMPGSMHGYDICSPHEINPDLGTEEEFRNFATECKKRNIKLLLDVVANHMSASSYNPWWQDVLEKGPDSPFANYFDINFSPLRKDLQNRILLPILRSSFEEALEKDIGLRYRDGCFFITVYEYEFPMHLSCYQQFLPCEFTTKGDLNRLVLRKPDLYEHIVNALASADKEEILSKQAYLLAIWQEGPQDINYRRFFDINELAAVKVERAAVFDDIHKKLLGYLDEGVGAGLRIDHPDGFYDPKAYFKKLEKYFVVIEKILEEGEALPKEWPVNGTVGYEFLNDLNHLFIDCENREIFEKIYQKFTGEKKNPKEMLIEAKREFALLYMTSEVDTFAARLEGDTTQIKKELVELIARFPCYRTYVDEVWRDEDRKTFEKIFSEIDAPLLQKILLNPENSEHVRRLQQLTPPIVAKGLEDTFCYRYFRFISANEVGGNPTRFGLSKEEFHVRNQKRSIQGLLTSSTHDTKRSEDVRYRLDVLSEMPKVWERKVTEWSKINQQYKSVLGPEPNLEYFIYQTLVGAWPHGEMDDPEVFLTRMRNYFYKAIREAKIHTNWINHNDNYENAITNFLIHILDQKKNGRFFKSFIPFIEMIRPLGQLNSLSALAIKIASPGIMETYQGLEFWDDSLVDPDNRRLVDFSIRQETLQNHPPQKMHMLRCGLHLRKAAPKLFTEGEYIPIAIRGPLEKHLIAFKRKYQEKELVCIAARFFHALGKPPVGATWEENFLQLDSPLAGKELFTGKRKEGTQIQTLLAENSVALIPNFEVKIA
ncbi:MAG: malto-oligosyltrehalose synthase [Candidatus Algichlamydia australiensis]|nr:malto-oligosyltrehalose synthase [Chlamydiales bacterium]